MSSKASQLITLAVEAATRPEQTVQELVMRGYSRLRHKGQRVAARISSDILARRLGIVGCLVLLTIVLSACDPYYMVRNINIGDPGTVPSFQEPAPLNILDATHDAVPVNLGGQDQCNDNNWFVSWAMQIIAGAVTRFMYEIMNDAYKIFATAVNITASRTPYEDNAVKYVWDIVQPLAYAIIPFSIVWAGMKSSIGGGQLAFNYHAIARVIPKAIVMVILLVPMNGDNEGALAYLLSGPVIFCNKVFEVFAKLAVGATNDMHSFAGIFSGTLACNILGVLIIIVFGAVIAAMMILLAVIFTLRAVVIDIYFVMFLLVAVASLFDELADYAPRFAYGYLQAAVSVVPLGIVLLLMSAFVAPQTGDGGEIAAAVNMLFVIICLYAAIKITDKMMQGGIERGIRTARRAVGGAAEMAGAAASGGATAAAKGGKLVARGAGKAAKAANEFGGKTTHARWTPDDGWQETTTTPRERIRMAVQPGYQPSPRPAQTSANSGEIVGGVGAYQNMPSGVESFNQVAAQQQISSAVTMRNLYRQSANPTMMTPAPSSSGSISRAPNQPRYAGVSGSGNWSGNSYRSGSQPRSDGQRGGTADHRSKGGNQRQRKSANRSNYLAADDDLD